MANNVTGADAINKGVSSLISQNQSTNETNIEASLNTRVSTAKEEYFASKEAILGDTQKVSDKVKTFSVFDTKQAVSPVIADVGVKLSTELDTVASTSIAQLEAMTGMSITSDSDLDIARKAQNSLAASKLAINSTLSEMRDSSLSLIPPSLHDSFSSLFATGEDLVSRSFSFSDALSEGASLFSSTFIEPALGKISLDDPVIDPYFGGVDPIEEKIATDDTVGQQIVDALSLEEFIAIKNDMTGTLGEFNTCPELEDTFVNGNMIDLSALLEALRRLLDLNIDLGCFSGLLDRMGSGGLGSLLNGALSMGNVSNILLLVDKLGVEKVTDPAGVVREVANNKVPKQDDYGNTLPIDQYDDDINSLLTTFGITKEDVFGDIDDIIDIPKLTSYPNDDTLSFGFGSDKVDFLRSLPTFT